MGFRHAEKIAVFVLWVGAQDFSPATGCCKHRGALALGLLSIAAIRLLITFSP